MELMANGRQVTPGGLHERGHGPWQCHVVARADHVSRLVRTDVALIRSTSADEGRELGGIGSMSAGHVVIFAHLR